jgi:hypothetical protein
MRKHFVVHSSLFFFFCVQKKKQKKTLPKAARREHTTSILVGELAEMSLLVSALAESRSSPSARIMIPLYCGLSARVLLADFLECSKNGESLDRFACDIFARYCIKK